MDAVVDGQISQKAKINHMDVYAAGNVPVIEMILDDQGSKTGIIANGGYTDDNRPEIIGRGRPGDLVHVYEGRYLLGHAVVGNDGTWSFTPVIPLASGKHSISVIHEAPSGAVSEESAPYLIIVDRVAPEKPVIEEVHDDVGAQTGSVGNGGTTDDNLPTLSGKGEAGATVTIIDNGQVIGEALVADDGNWSFTPGGELPDGRHEFEVVMTDQAGNASETSDKHVIEVQVRVPTQIASVTSMSKDWGVSSSDWLTNDGGAGRLMQGSLSAQLAADERLLVSTDGGLSWTQAMVDGLSWAAQDNNSHAGNWSIQTKVVNDAGRSGEVESREVILDTLAPDAPTKLTVDGAYLTVAFNTASVSAGDIVSVVLNGQRFDHSLTVKDVSAGSVRIAPGFSVASGDVMAAIIDKAGNSSKYRDMGEQRYIDFTGAGYVDLNTGQSTTHKGLRITSEYDYNLSKIYGLMTGLTNYDPAINTGMKIGVTGRTRIDFTEGPVSEVKFLVTNLQAGYFAATTVRFYSASGAQVGQQSLSAYWPNTVNAHFKAPAGQEFSYMVVTTGARIPGKCVIGDWDWIGLDNFEFRGGASELNVLANQTIENKAGTYYGGNEDNVFTLANVAHINAATSGGVAGGGGADTLKLTGAKQVLDLALLKDKIDSIEIFDITGSGNNTLKMSIADVLGTGARDQFVADGNVQVLVKGNAGDNVVLGAMMNGAVQGEWQLQSQVVVAGITYDVYKHSLFAAEVLVQSGVGVQLDMSIVMMGKDSHTAGDYSTADGSSGRLVQGELTSVLPIGARIEVSTDGGKQWGTALVKDGKWYFTDMQPHAQSWTIQARVVSASGTVGQTIERNVELTAKLGAPSIVKIAEAEGVLTAVEASNGVDMIVSLDGSSAKAGDIVHVQWGIATYSHVLTAAQFTAGQVTVKVPAAVTSNAVATAQGVAYDFDVAVSIVANGVQGPKSDAYSVIGGGFATKALSDTLNIASTLVIDDAYIGKGVTVSAVNGTLSKGAATTATLAGLTLTGGEDAVLHFDLEKSANKFQLTLSGLDNTAGGAVIVIYDVAGNELKRETITGTLTSKRYVKAYAFTAPEGVDVGSFDIIPAGGKITVGAFSQTQVTHVSDIRDANTIDELVDTYYGGAGDDVITLKYAAATYLANAGNKGIHGGDGIDVLKIAGAGQALNLNLATSAGKLSGVEVIDLTGTGNNTLTLSLKDVLANGQVDLFHQGEKQTVQMMVKGNAGDVVNIDDLLGTVGPDLGDWASMGKQSIEGVSYVVYQHSGLDAELLVQDTMKVGLI